ncbi:MAG: hypothetical protein ACRDVC_05990 [Acidimicrobiales bacterium]
MRRVLLAAFFVAASVVIYVAPSGADSPIFSNVVLSFDFSDNAAPASATGVQVPNATGPSLACVATSTNSVCTNAFNIIADVLPENTGGFVRMVAIAPVASGLNDIVCPFQPVQQSQVECGFNFTADGVWQIRAEYGIDTISGVSSVSVTSLRVTN